MDRGLRAQPSPNEESTLRQIADTGLNQSHLRQADVQQLHTLDLIETREGAWCLTDIGMRRLAAL